MKNYKVSLEIADKSLIILSSDKILIDKIRLLYEPWIIEKEKGNAFKIYLDIKYQGIIDDIPSFCNSVRRKNEIFYFKNHNSQGFFDFNKKKGKFQINDSDLPLYFTYWNDNLQDLEKHIKGSEDIYPFLFDREQSIKDALKLAITSFDYSLRVIIINYFSCLSFFEETYFIHSCAVSKNLKGYVFIGNGGAGKTTIAKLSDGLKNTLILNDDMNIISCLNGQFYIFSSPFNTGRKPTNFKVKLQGIYVLNKSSKNFTLDIKKNKRLSYFLQNTPLNLNLINNFELSRRKILDYKWKNLYFKKDSSFWNIL